MAGFQPFCPFRKTGAAFCAERPESHSHTTTMWRSAQQATPCRCHRELRCPIRKNTKWCFRQPLHRRGRQRLLGVPGAEGFGLDQVPFYRPDPLLSLGSDDGEAGQSTRVLEPDHRITAGLVTSEGISQHQEGLGRGAGPVGDQGRPVCGPCREVCTEGC